MSAPHLKVEVDRPRIRAVGRRAYTWTLVVLTVPLGVRGARKSVPAMRAATIAMSVVRYPKVFCKRTRELCMLGSLVARAQNSENREQCVVRRSFLALFGASSKSSPILRPCEA
jgi:hypothetical protein